MRHFKILFRAAHFFRSSTLKVLPSRFYLKGSTFFIDSGPGDTGDDRDHGHDDLGDILLVKKKLPARALKPPASALKLLQVQLPPARQ
jgi:hypothetical protein